MTTKHYFFNTIVPTTFYGVITGLITGTVIWGYQYLAEKLTSVSQSMYAFFRDHLAFLPLLIAILVAAALISYFNTRLVPQAKGGGVPLIEGVTRGIIPLGWYKTLPSVVAGSYISFVCGLPLGSEGPSVLIGGSIGCGVNSIGGKYDKKRQAWSRLCVTGGASAGFATALNAPLAGILFALEECHKKFSPVVLLMATVSVLFSQITAGLLRLVTATSAHSLLDTGIINLSVTELYLPLIAGIVIGLAAVGFSLLLKHFPNLMKNLKLPDVAKFILVFILSGAACFFFADAIGGGSALIKKVSDISIEWQIILVLLFIKVVLLTFCSYSKVTGGMFIPFLCLGALVGGLVAKVMVACGMNEAYYTTIVVVSMCAFLGAVCKAPITATVLIVELAGGASSLLVGLVAIIISYLITELLHTKPIYDEMLEDMLHSSGESKFVEFTITVREDSYAVGKLVHDMSLPTSVVEVIHKDAYEGENDDTLYRNGQRIVRAGDTLIIEARTRNEAELKKELYGLFGSPADQ